MLQLLADVDKFCGFRISCLIMVEHAMCGFVKGILNIYTSFVSHTVLGWGIRTFKFWGVLRMLMISLRLIPLGKHNTDFHPMVGFLEASPLRYALTVKPTVYVSHLRQFWSTARIQTMEEGTKILATIDDIVRTVSESSLRRNLKLRDEEGISYLPDAELFENLTLMGYNISPNQKFTFPKGQFSHQWKYLIYTIMQCLSPKSTGFNEFSSNIATALVCLATNRTYNFSKMIFDGLVKNVNNKSSVPPSVADEPASPHRDVSQREACPTDSGFIAGQDRATIAKSSTLPYDSAPRVTSPAAVEEEREGAAVTNSRHDAPIKGRSIDEGEAVIERVSNDTEEMATVLTSMDATTVLASGVVNVPTGSGSIPTASTLAEGTVPTGREEIPTASPVFATAIVIAKDVEIARIHAKKELQSMIDGLDSNNETVAKYLEEYRQFSLELPMERRIELSSDLVKYQDNYTKEEAERIKRKGITLEQESVKKQKSSEEITEEVKSPEEVTEEKIKEMMQLVLIEEVYVEALQVKHPIIDWKVHSEGQRSYWKITRLGGSSACYHTRPPTSDKEMELWVEISRLYEPDKEDQLWTHTQNFMHALVEWKLYDTCGVHHVTSKDKEIFMLVEKDYPLRKGLALVMICYKLQVENFSQMANDLVLKIYKIGRIVGNKMYKAFPLPVIKFPLAEAVPTVSIKGCHCQKKCEAAARKIALLC
nr:synaptobrevin, longin-like domain protein [Tanacetum cinerariifolium]